MIGWQYVKAFCVLWREGGDWVPWSAVVNLARAYIYNVYGISKSRHLLCKAHRISPFLSAVWKRVFYPVLGDFGVRGMLKSGLENQNE